MINNAEEYIVFNSCFLKKNVFDEKISEIDWKSTTIRNYLLIDERNKSKENKIIDRNTAEMIDDVLEL